MLSADLCIVFLECLLTACRTNSANHQNHSMLVLEWGVADKQADLAVIVKERVFGTCPRLLIPNRVGYCLSLVSRHSLEE